MKTKTLTLAITTTLLTTTTTLAAWTYTGTTTSGTISHNETPWVLNVSRSGTELTITSVKTSSTPYASSLPLGDTVNGYTITAIASASWKSSGVFSADYKDSPGFYARNLTLPATLRTIGDYAFYACSALTGTLTIPSGVTNIGNYAFYKCRSLTGALRIPSGVTSIGEYTFYNCNGLTGALTIPNSVTSIGTYAFHECNGLTGALTIGNSVIRIETCAFMGCSGLTSVTIPGSVTSIGDSAFYGCSDLISMTIGSGVTTIGERAFYDCRSLTGVTFNGAFPSEGSYRYAHLTLLYSSSSPVTSYVYSAYAASWWDVSNGPIANGKATWQGRPIRLAAGSPPAVTVTVTYNVNGGNAQSPTSKDVTVDSVYGALPTPTRTGYTFAGWWTGTTSGTQVTSSTVVAITANHTLYARWTANTYTVTFDSQSGSTVTGKNVTYGSTYGTLTSPTRTGYTFAGWWTGMTTGTQVTAATVVNTASPHTLYARWTAAAVHDFVFGKPNGWEESLFLSDTADGKTPVTTFLQGQTIYLSYLLTDNKKQDFNGVMTNKLSISGSSGMLGSQLEFFSNLPGGYYAGQTGWSGWSVLNSLAPGTYTITARLNEGNIVPETDYGNNTKSITFTVADPATSVSVTFNGNGGMPATQPVIQTLNARYMMPDTPTLAGHMFVGWYTAASGGTQVTMSTVVTTTTAHMLYARWAAVTPVSFAEALDTPALQWTASADEWGAGAHSYKSATLSNDGVDMAVLHDCGTLSTTVSGPGVMKFWFRSLELHDHDHYLYLLVDEEFYDDGVLNDFLLSTQWKQCALTVTGAGAHTIAFNLDGGNDVFIDQVEWMPSSPDAVHDFGFYTPAGWGDSFFLSDTATGKTPVTTFLQGQTIYFSLAVRDNSNQNFSGTMKTVLRRSDLTSGFNCTMNGLQPDRYTSWSGISSWTVVQNLAPGSYTVTAKINDDNAVPETNYGNNEKSITFTVAAAVSVTFNGNGGEPASRTVPQVTGSNYVLPDDPTRTGHIFIGWFTREDGGTRVTAATPVAANAAAHTLYAQWQVVTTGRWRYSGSWTAGTLSHNEGAWVLDVSRSGDSLTVLGFAAASGSRSGTLPLADTVEDGLAITAVAHADGTHPAFTGCSGLTGVTFPQTLTQLGRGAFASCDLAGVTVPSSVTDYGEGFAGANDENTYGWSVFQNNPRLAAITVAPGNPAYSGDSNGAVFGDNGKTLLDFPAGCTGSYTVPSTVTAIRSAAFGGTRLTSVTIPNSVTRMGEDTFFDSSVSSVTISDNVELIQYGTFAGCTNLASVVFGKRVNDFHSPWSELHRLASVTFRGPYPDDLIIANFSDDMDETDRYEINAYGESGFYDVLDDFDERDRPLLPPVTTYILSENAASWNPHVLNGPVSGGKAIWMGRPIKLQGTSGTSVIVTFDAGAGSPASRVTSQTLNANYALPTPPTRAGHTFAGWFTQAAGGTQVSASTKVTAATSHTLHARWTPITCTVTFDGRGGTPARQTWLATVGQPYVLPEQPTRPGCTFNGWFTAPTGGTKVTAATVADTAAAHTLYAQWTGDTYTVTYDSNDGTSATQPRTVTVTQPYVLPPRPTREGFTFLGWFTAPTGGTLVTAFTEVTAAAAHTLYAHWHEGSLPTLGVSANGPVIFDNSGYPPVIIIPGAVPSGGVAATASMTGATGLKITVKGLPAGMKYDAKTGQITGAPTKSGTFTITVTVTGANKATATQTFTMEVAALQAEAVGAFSGYVADASGTIGGTFTLTAAKTGKLTAKVVTPAGSQSFSAKFWDAVGESVFTAAMANKKAALDCRVNTASGTGALGVSGTFTLDGVAYTVVGQRAEAAPAGTYTVALPVDGAPLAKGPAENAPLGDGYLTITVNAKGVAKLAGLGADGATKLSGSVPLLHVGGEWVIPAVFKVNGGKGYFGGLLRFAGDGRVSGAAWLWRYPGKKPGKQDDDRFTVELAPFGGTYAAADIARYAGLFFVADAPPVGVWEGEWFYMPDVPVTEKNGALSLPAGKKPSLNRATGLYEFDTLSGNPAVATLAVTKKSGVIKGKFNAYSAFDDGTFTQSSVSYAGVLLPAFLGESGTDVGRGSYLIPWDYGKQKLKTSYRVRIAD